MRERERKRNEPGNRVMRMFPLGVEQLLKNDRMSSMRETFEECTFVDVTQVREDHIANGK